MSDKIKNVIRVILVIVCLIALFMCGYMAGISHVIMNQSISTVVDDDKSDTYHVEIDGQIHEYTE